MKVNIKNRTIFNHDNINILQGINSNSIDLIYLDPPFNKKKEFTAPMGSSSEGASFKDWFREEDVKDDWVQTIKEDNIGLYNFLNGVKNLSNITSSKNNKHYLYNYCYLSYMAIRLIEMQRILKDTGSIYLHCDPTMSHYLKILMDIIFGEKNLIGTIVWKRHTSLQKGSQFKAKTWGVTNDDILHYSKTNNYLFKNTRDLKEDEKIKKFNQIDNKTGNRFYDDTSHLWRNKAMGNRPNLCYEWRGFKNPHPSGWRLSKERLEEEYQKGNIVITKENKLQRRKYLKDYEGVPIGNFWDDINNVQGKERTGYPTQKPLSLLERIIKASSNENDMVLDPFCGCATTCVASEKLNRQWIGVDVSVRAYDLVRERLNKEIKEGKNALLKWNEEITFKTNSPKRTDTSSDDTRLKKYVYIISNPNYNGFYKVGIAKDYKARLTSYQISDPLRGYKLEYKIHTHLFRETEKHIHAAFDNLLEWVQGSKEDIINEIEKFLNK